MSNPLIVFILAPQLSRLFPTVPSLFSCSFSRSFSSSSSYSFPPLSPVRSRTILFSYSSITHSSFSILLSLRFPKFPLFLSFAFFSSSHSSSRSSQFPLTSIPSLLFWNPSSLLIPRGTSASFPAFLVLPLPLPFFWFTSFLFRSFSFSFRFCFWGLFLLQPLSNCFSSFPHLLTFFHLLFLFLLILVFPDFLQPDVIDGHNSQPDTDQLQQTVQMIIGRTRIDSENSGNF